MPIRWSLRRGPDQFKSMRLKAVFIPLMIFTLCACGAPDTGKQETENHEAEEETAVYSGEPQAVEQIVTVPAEQIMAGAEAAAEGEQEDMTGNRAPDETAEESDADIQETEASDTEQVSENVMNDKVSENSEDDMISENSVPEETAQEMSQEESSVTADGVFTSEPVPDEVFARMSGVSFPADCTIAREELRYLRLSYIDFAGQTRIGEMVCNKRIAGDLTEIFSELYKCGYQIEKIRLIDDYGGDDDLSCADNNTSCFNYRTVAGSTNLSKHAMGVAIDINPFYNPYVTYPDGVERISPPGSEPYADRSADFPYKIGPGDKAYELFKAHGFTWGGSWKTLKDYQHFQKAG